MLKGERLDGRVSCVTPSTRLQRLKLTFPLLSRTASPRLDELALEVLLLTRAAHGLHAITLCLLAPAVEARCFDWTLLERYHVAITTCRSDCVDRELVFP